MATAAAGEGSDDDIEVISSTNNGTKFGSAMGGFRNILPKPGPGETHCQAILHSYTLHFTGGPGLLNKKSNADQGFEIIKEVPGGTGAPRMGNPFSGGMFGSNPNLSNLAALMAGGNMTSINNMSSLLAGMGSGSSNMSGLINQSSMLQKCEYCSKD